MVTANKFGKVYYCSYHSSLTIQLDREIFRFWKRKYNSFSQHKGQLTLIYRNILNGLNCTMCNSSNMLLLCLFVTEKLLETEVHMFLKILILTLSFISSYLLPFRNKVSEQYIELCWESEMELFCENSIRPKATNYFYKNLYLKYLTGFYNLVPKTGVQRMST